VQEVDRGSVGDAAPQRGEALEATAGADDQDGATGLAQDDIERGIVAPSETKFSARSEETTGGQDSVVRDASAAPVTLRDDARVAEVSVGAADGRRCGVVLLGEYADARQLRSG
jgi:hypothetical protein